MAELRARVWRVEPQSPSQFLLVLIDEYQQLLPMTIGVCEALAIQSAVSPAASRQIGVSHDLLTSFITRLGGRLSRVVIDDLWNKVYFAKLHITIDGKTVAVDCRPSDAVAVALRMDAPLFVTDAVMAAASDSSADQETPPEGDLDL